jgi:protease IV
MEETQQKSKAWIILGIILGFIALSVLSIALYHGMFASSRDTYGGYDWSCNVAGIAIRGEIVTYAPPESFGEPDQYGNPTFLENITPSEYIVNQINDAEFNPSIKGILVDIDSYGGYPVAGEEIEQALRGATKPTVSLIRENGVSAAYWIATGTDRIFASKISNVGSIGVTMSYVQTDDPDSRYIELASGKYKDTGNPSKAITEDERQLLLRDLKLVHEHFIDVVSNNRNIPREKVAAFADGSSMLGDQAKAEGLIDDIGSWKEAEAYLATQIGEQPTVCW